MEDLKHRINLIQESLAQIFFESVVCMLLYVGIQQRLRTRYSHEKGVKVGCVVGSLLKVNINPHINLGHSYSSK